MDNINENKKKETGFILEPTTQSAAKPGDFPVGSLKSRAAARSILKNKPETVVRVKFVGVSKTSGIPLPQTKVIRESNTRIEFVYDDQ